MLVHVFDDDGRIVLAERSIARAELLTEVALESGRWRLCEPRAVRDGAIDIDGVVGSRDLTEWLFEPSITSRFGSRHV